MNIQELISSPLLQEWLNPELLSLESIELMRSEFLSAKPFQHAYIDNFLQEEKLETVIEELAEQEFEVRESDLFQLAQTPDVEELDAPILNQFKEVLASVEFRKIMKHITGIEVSQSVDCLGNIYQDTDYLLCHDDKLIRRKIAYILYLTDLEETEGGGLHLFDTDENKQPNAIVKKIFPRRNRLTFFKVTRQSFHEVGEVLGQDTFRVSLSGWFNND